MMQYFLQQHKPPPQKQQQNYSIRLIEEETVVVTQINLRKRTLTLSNLPGPGKVDSVQRGRKQI